MGRPKSSIPKFSVTKDGRAFTKVEGRFISLGRADSPESKLRFAKVLEDHASGVLTTTARKPAPSRPTVSVNQVAAMFVGREFPRYSRSEQFCQSAAIKVLREMFGESPAVEFGPLRLRAVRESMVAGAKDRKPWARETVNRQVKRIQSIFRWAVSVELVPAEVAAALGTLRALSAGETEAADNDPRAAVPDGDLQAVRDKLLPRHRDVFDLLLLTAARPGEILALRMKDIDRSGGDIWKAEIKRHKTAVKGKRRVLFFNLAAQEILTRHFKADPDARLFPMRRDNFGALMKRACLRAGVTPFVAHQLRHTTITKIADELGIEHAQKLAGHADAVMTAHYARLSDRQAIDAVRKLG